MFLVPGLLNHLFDRFTSADAAERWGDETSEKRVAGALVVPIFRGVSVADAVNEDERHSYLHRHRMNPPLSDEPRGCF
jgi:hypothetical protein